MCWTPALSVSCCVCSFPFGDQGSLCPVCDTMLCVCFILVLSAGLCDRNLAGQQEHCDPNSYSWCLMRFAIMRSVLINLRTFLPQIGIELSGDLHSLFSLLLPSFASFFVHGHPTPTEAMIPFNRPPACPHHPVISDMSGWLQLASLSHLPVQDGLILRTPCTDCLNRCSCFDKEKHKKKLFLNCRVKWNDAFVNCQGMQCMPEFMCAPCDEWPVWL